MSANNIEILKKYFSIPYGGHVFIFTNPVTLLDIQQNTFTEILSHKNAVDAQGLPGHSMALLIIEAVKKHMNGLDGKQILDVGGNTGYISFLAVEAGANATMIERDTVQATVAKAMADVRGLKVNIINDSIQNYLNSNQDKFDCAFMLNMFDQMLREDETTAWQVLKQISERAKTLFLMMGRSEQIPKTNGHATGTPLIAAPVLSRHDKTDYEVILEKTMYNNYKILSTNIYGSRQLQAYY